MPEDRERGQGWPGGNRRTMNSTVNTTVELREGDIVEFSLKGDRRTAEVMLVTSDDVVLLDLFDGDRPAWAHRAPLEDVEVYRPDAADLLVAA